METESAHVPSMPAARVTHVGDHSTMVERFRVAFICTGNRFRSPLAAAVFEQESARGDVQATSFGSLDIGPMPPLKEAVKASRSIGLDIAGHLARALPLADLALADLVVGFEQVHLDAAVREADAPPDKTFTLPELVSFLERQPPTRIGHPIERARSRVIRAHLMRLATPSVEAPEIADPIGLRPGKQDQIADAVERLTRRLARLLFEDNGSSRAD